MGKKRKRMDIRIKNTPIDWSKTYKKYYNESKEFKENDLITLIFLCASSMHRSIRSFATISMKPENTDS